MEFDKVELTVKPEVANEIISHLQGQEVFYNQMGMKLWGKGNWQISWMLFTGYTQVNVQDVSFPNVHNVNDLHKHIISNLKEDISLNEP